MDSTADADLGALDAASEHLSAALRSVDASQFHCATPCDGWDLAELIDHVVGGNWFTTKVLGGLDADAAMAATMERFGDGSAGIDQAVASVDEQLGGFAGPGALDGRWSHIVGELTGRQMLRLRLHDLIVHTWDIQSALDVAADVPVELVRWGLGELSDPESLTATHFGLDGLGAAQSTTDGDAYLRVFARQS